MKNLNILKAITLFSAIIFLQTFGATGAKAQSVCVLNSSDEIVTDDKGYVDCYSSIGTQKYTIQYIGCLLYTSDAADDSLRVDLGGRRIIKKR